MTRPRGNGHHEQVGRPPAASVGRLVGRDESLGVLRAAVRHAYADSPSVLLMSGETGVGKTRLVRELVDLERVTLLYGACVPMAGDPLPFAPLTQALRRLDRSGTLNLQLERSPDLARLVPGLIASKAASIVGSATPAEPGPGTQLGLFQSVLGLVDRLGAAAPVLLVVEDVHWADRSTLDLVRYLAANLTVERAVLLVTYRADAVVTGTPVATWLAELGRLDITERVELDRLMPADAVVLIRQLAGDDADPDLVASTLARSAGNPLFAEHLVLQDRAPGRNTLPTTLHELLRSRIHELPEGTQSVLQALAVLGRPTSVLLLAATAGIDQDESESLLRPALEQHVVELRRDDTLGFRHPAFGEVVYSELLPGQRRRLHRAAAESLEPVGGLGTGQRSSVSADAVSGELARHWIEAGDTARALDASVAAGWAAERMYAFADAHASFTRAVSMLDDVPAAPQDRVRLLKHAAQSASLMGDGHEAARLVEAALELTAQPRRRAALSARLGSIRYLAGRGDLAEGCFEEALSLVPPDEQSILVARCYAGLAQVRAAWADLDGADLACEKGLVVARSIGARREEGLVYNALGVVACIRGDLDTGIAHLRTALTIAAEVGNPNDLASAYINLSNCLGVAGRVDEAVELAHQGTEALTRVGLGRQSLSFLKANVGKALIDAGRMREGSEYTEDALAHLPHGVMAAPVLIQSARVSLVTGDLTQAWERLEQARVIIESENAPDEWMRTVLETGAEIELWAGRPAAAYDLVVDGLDLIAGTDEERWSGTLVALGFRALATGAETHRDLESRRRLAVRRVRLDAGRTADRSTLPHSAAVLAWQHAEATRLDLDSDPAAWAETAALMHGLGRPFPTAYARWREAEARLDSGVDGRAIAALREAHASALALGAVKLADECERLARWHRIDLVAAVEGGGNPSTSGIDAYGLTPRELEVLSGLSAGRTNQEIADELFISVKTASVHVSNILRKLDVRGRQEAARVAYRLGVGV